MKVHIKMAKQFFLVDALMEVTLNGQECAWLGSGDEIELDAPIGQNTILFKASIRKKEIRFSSEDDVSITLKWNRVWGNIEALLVGKDVKVLK